MHLQKSQNNTLTAVAIQTALRNVASKERAKINAWFFKTGKGEYGEGDVFLGVTVPEQRKVARRFIDTSLEEEYILLQSPIHEHRLTALLILTLRYKKADVREQKKIVTFYLANLNRVNNWDLVDLSAYHILGAHILNFGGGEKLHTLAKSKNLWKRRVSIVATYALLREKDFTCTLELAEQLLSDSEDLIHKATGWMLREVGKRDIEVLRTFLSKHFACMPRTMLRYAIERFPKSERRIWLSKA